MSAAETSGYPPYPAYKDSGVEWLGEVPEHWEVLPLGRMGMLFKGNGGNKQDEVESGVPCIRYGDLYTTHEFFIRSSRAYVTAERAAVYTPIQYGDVLFAASGETVEEIGKSAVNLLTSQACCGGDIILFRPERELDEKYLGYAADSRASQGQKAVMGRGYTVIHIYGSQLKYLMLAVPPLPEQRAIAAYLDGKTAEIDALIAAKERLIALLQEKRAALITRAVTKGLDSAAPLKDSGVEWLGEVPEGWEVRKLRWLMRQVRRPVAVQPDVEYQEIGIRSWGKGIFHKEPLKGALLEEKSVYYVEEDDLVLNIVFAWEGAVATVSPQEKGMIASHRFPTFRHTDEVDLDYLLLFLQSEHGRALMLFNSPGAAGRNKTIRLGQLLNEEIPLPPLEEQAKLATFVREQIEYIDSGVIRVSDAISYLREYRAALISAVVTGKIDVREKFL